MEPVLPRSEAASAPPPPLVPGRSRARNRRVSSQHVCQFYESPDFLCEAASRFLVEGIRAGQQVLLIAEPAHREDMARRVGQIGVSFDDVVNRGQLAWSDVDDTLAGIMDGDMPDRERFTAVMTALLDRITARAPSRPVRIFGEMVDALWRVGNPSAALRLEEMWNELAESRPFQLLCGYSMGHFHAAAHSSSFAEVCAQHARAIPTEGFTPTPDEAAREREHRRELEGALRQALHDRTRAEEALVEAKDQAEHAARAKSEFLALMSHELRTPLNAILGYQDLLEHGVGGEVNAEQRAYLSRMRSCSEQLLRLIDQVLSLSRLEATAMVLSPELLDAPALARETAALVEPGAMRRGLGLEVTARGGELTLFTDGGAVRQILLNLLTNAIKFTDAGCVRLEVARTDETVAFHVIDTGIGIRPEDQERIFEPFVQVESIATRRFGGSGLGLAVSRDMARVLGGDLAVASEPGRGSTFTLALPRAAPAAA